MEVHGGGDISLHQSLDDGLGVERFQVGVSLSSANEDDGLTCNVGHGDSGADL